MHEVRKGNPCQICSICVFRVRLKKGTLMRRIQRINTETTLNSSLLTFNSKKSVFPENADRALFKLVHKEQFEIVWHWIERFIQMTF